MPKKPTKKVLAALAGLRALATDGGGGVLPTMRELGGQFGVHAATIFRLLLQLRGEGVVWQHPSGRFYPAAAQGRAVSGLPLVVVGRQMRGWSALYREILEGVAAVCAAQSCPMVLLSSELLLRHRTVALPPEVAGMEVQRPELRRLSRLAPRTCAGLLFDHLWLDAALDSQNWGHVPKAVLMRPGRAHGFGCVLPDFSAGAKLLVRHLLDEQIGRIFVAEPFAGDASVAACSAAFLQRAVRLEADLGPLELADASTPAARRRLVRRALDCGQSAAIVCAEDNVAVLLAQELTGSRDWFPGSVRIGALQGTGAAGGAIIDRVRYDYRELGRLAALELLGGVVRPDSRPVRCSPRFFAANPEEVVAKSG